MKLIKLRNVAEASTGQTIYAYAPFPAKVWRWCQGGRLLCLEKYLPSEQALCEVEHKSIPVPLTVVAIHSPYVSCIHQDIGEVEIVMDSREVRLYEKGD